MDETQTSPLARHVAIDGRLLSRPISGIERYVSSIAAAIKSADAATRCTLFAGWPVPETSPKGITVIPTLNDRNLLAAQRVVSPDVFHVTWCGHSLAHYLPLVQSRAGVLTIHDLILFHHPEYMPVKDRQPYAAALKLGASWAARIIVPSEYTKREVIDHLAVPDDRVDVILEGVDERFSQPADLIKMWHLRNDHRLPQSFFLHVGKDFPHKNLQTLVRAFALVRKGKLRSHQLVLVGQSVWPESRRQLLSLAKTLGVEDDVLYLDHVDDDDLPTIYQMADALVFPSLAEGFGLPPLEAMAAGTPTVSSNATSIPEVVGDAGLLVDAHSSEAMAEAMTRIVLDHPFRHELIRLGRARANSLSWERTAEATLEAYELALQQVIPKPANWWLPPDGLLGLFREDVPALHEVETLSSQAAVARPGNHVGPPGLENGSVSPAEKFVQTEGPSISIVIPTLNRLAFTRACIDGLERTLSGRKDVEIIIVDNGSTDGTRMVLDSLRRPYRALLNEENLGFGAACNQGAAEARGQKLLFLNNDTVPLDGWLEPMLETAADDANTGVVGSKLLYPDGTIQHAGAAVSIEAVPVHLFVGFRADFPPANEMREYQAVTAACMLVDRDLFRSLEGFDESYRTGYEDADFCMRVREAGHRVVYCPRSQLIHFESMSAGRFDYDDENRNLFLSRWKDVVVIDYDIWQKRAWRVMGRDPENVPLTALLGPIDHRSKDARRVTAQPQEIATRLPTPLPPSGGGLIRAWDNLRLKIDRKFTAIWYSYVFFWEQARFNQSLLQVLDTYDEKLHQLEAEVMLMRGQNDADLRTAPTDSFSPSSGEASRDLASQIAELQGSLRPPSESDDGQDHEPV